MIAALCACEPISYFWREIIDPTSGSNQYKFYCYYVVPVPTVTARTIYPRVVDCMPPEQLFQNTDANTNLSQCLRRKRYSHPLHYLPPQQQNRYHMGPRQCRRVVNHRAVHRDHLRLSPCPAAMGYCHDIDDNPPILQYNPSR